MFNKSLSFIPISSAECKDSNHLDLAKLPKIHRMPFQLTRYYLRDEVSGKIHFFYGRK